MKSFLKKHSRDMAMTVAIILCGALFGMMILLFNRYQTVLDEQVDLCLVARRTELQGAMDDTVIAYEEIAQATAEHVASLRDPAEVGAALNGLLSEEPYRSAVQGVHYWLGGVEYADGALYENELSVIRELYSRGTAGHTGVVRNPELNMNAIVFYVPTEADRPEGTVEGVAIICSTVGISDFCKRYDENVFRDAQYFALCDGDGNVLLPIRNLLDRVGPYQNLPDAVQTLSGDSKAEGQLRQLLGGAASGTVRADFGGSTYAVSVSACRGGGLYLVGVYHAEDLYVEGYQYIQVILTVVIVLLALFVILFIFTRYMRRSYRNRISSFGMTDPVLNCPTKACLARDMRAVLPKHPNSHFAVVSCAVVHFDYLDSTRGGDFCEDLLSFISYACRKMLAVAEQYAYNEKGEFYLCLHYRTKSALINRLRGLNALLANRTVHEDNGDTDNLSLEFGIVLLEGAEDETPEKLFEKASRARTGAPGSEFGEAYRFYTKTFLDKYMMEANMDLTMESGMENGEFIVFYQPKMNLHTGRLDSAEALVRWYDPATDSYRSPSTFIPFFEMNGFINRLDRYIYEQVLKMLGERIREGRPIVPVSVNISRVTLQKPDFIDFYVGLKNQYKIRDGYITLEITESVAYDNYENMALIVERLRRNGFLCSVDDFGTGYSSYHLLKTLQMDEIKLDGSLLRAGLSPDRDRTVLKHIVSLTENLHMKIVQEGVETQEQVDMLKALSFDVIQGYYYSKPLSPTDYCVFLDNHEDEILS